MLNLVLVMCLFCDDECVNDIRVLLSLSICNVYVCRKLGAEEAVRQAVETREAQVKEKAQSLEQAETRHR